MTELADASIAALRAQHDQLATLVGELSPEQLTGPSGAEEWTVADVLSHLGSGSELTGLTLAAAITGVPSETDNQAVWDRWNALPPAEQAAGFVEHHGGLVTTLEGLDASQRELLRLDLGFLPEPVPLDVFVGMRLNETTAHSWDVRIGVDPEAVVDPTSADLVLRHFSTGLAFLLGFTAKPGELGSPATVALDGYGLVLDQAAAVVAGTPAGATATFAGPLEAAVRLLSGRLRPEYTPDGVEVTGNVSLDDLRKVFPGY